MFRAVKVRPGGKPSYATGVSWSKRGVRQLFNVPRHNGPVMEEHPDGEWSTAVAVKEALLANAADSSGIGAGARALDGHDVKIEEFFPPASCWTVCRVALVTELLFHCRLFFPTCKL
jgi:hypothetical protein